MTSKGNLLFFVAEDWYFAMHFLQFAMAAREDGWQVYLVCNTGQKGPEILDNIKRSGVVVLPIALSRTAITPFQDLHVLFFLHDLVKKIKPALIHAVALKPILLSQIISVRHGIPMLAMITGLGYVFTAKTLKASLVRPFVSIALKMAAQNVLTRFVVLNPEDAEWARQTFAGNGDRVIVIPGTGVDLNRFYPGEEPPEPFKLAYVGRMLKDKGIFELIEAIKFLRAKGVNLQLILVGAPDISNPESLSEKQLNRWQEEGLCEYLGHIADVECLLRRVHALVLPSYREGLGMSLLEAAATGLPCIATDVPGCRSAVVDGKTGLLVPAGNSVALADAVLKVVEDKALRKKLGDNAVEFVKENYSREIVLAQMVLLYNKMAVTEIP
ncbi:MAG: glycosyltransferase family 4 protein [Candidatus Riflebacteria bacterium]|nr:glycosyltransferase family 4 protein [Candidatus Riflebacteria bacterium]